MPVSRMTFNRILLITISLVKMPVSKMSVIIMPVSFSGNIFNRLTLRRILFSIMPFNIW
jgi:hypothetical protein